MSAERPKRCRDKWGDLRCDRPRYHPGKHWNDTLMPSGPLFRRVSWWKELVDRATAEIRQVRGFK